MFHKTFGLSDKRIRVVREKKYANKPFNTAYKHQNATRLSIKTLLQSVCGAIEKHISAFPTVLSHLDTISKKDRQRRRCVQALQCPGRCEICIEDKIQLSPIRIQHLIFEAKKR